MPSTKTPSVPAVERALAMLELLANSKTGLTLPELCRRLKLPKSSAHCILLTLERRNYLRRSEATNRYLFGLRLFGLANMALSGLALRERAAPILRHLMETTGATVHMAILEQSEAVLLEKIEPPGVARATWLGKRMDTHCTAIGKCLLAYMPEADLRRLIAEHGLPRHNENTITSVTKLRQEIAKIRACGYSIDDEEDELGFRCVGCPVFDSEGVVIAAISVAGTSSEIGPVEVASYAVKAKEAAACIREALKANTAASE
jgi:DNA-binding IclR family transcriptional regulator